MRKRFCKDFPQVFHRCIRIGICLKISNIFMDRPLCRKQCDLTIDLLCYRQLRICCKIPTSTGTSENTASAAKLTIPVGTGHSSVQSHLINFFSEPFPKHMIQRMIRLSIPVLLLCHHICIHTSVPSLFCSSFSSFGI